MTWKAIDHEVEGPHARSAPTWRYRESAAIIHAIAAHHGDIEAKYRRSGFSAGGRCDSAARPAPDGNFRELYQTSRALGRSPTPLTGWRKLLHSSRT